MQHEPIPGQSWLHSNGESRRVVWVMNPPSGSVPDMQWHRLDSKPGRIFSECSFKSWSRWVKGATLMVGTFEDYLADVQRAEAENPKWRSGQAFFNTLRAIQPHLAAQVEGGELDPFNSDERLPSFCSWVRDNWAGAV